MIAGWTALVVAAVVGAASDNEPPGLPPGFRAHVVVSEDVGADALYRLARPEVVLWVASRSNLLKASTADRLGLFGEAYVRLRPPLDAQALRPLARFTHVGAWLRDEDAPAMAAVLGARLRALDIDGELTEPRAQRAQAVGARRTRWAPRKAPTLEEWGRFAQLPGAKVLVWSSGDTLDAGCPLFRSLPSVWWWVDVAQPAALGHWVAACGFGIRAAVRESAAAALRPWLANSGTEIELDVADDAAASRAVGLLQALAGGP